MVRVEPSQRCVDNDWEWTTRSLGKSPKHGDCINLFLSSRKLRFWNRMMILSLKHNREVTGVDQDFANRILLAAERVEARRYVCLELDELLGKQGRLEIAKNLLDFRHKLNSRALRCV